MLNKMPLFLLFFCIAGHAIEKPPEVELDGDTIAADDSVLDLGTLEVVGERFTLKTETRLRIIRKAFNEPRSSLEADKDKLLCWLETPVGTHFRHVTCGRNGDLDALRLGGKSGQLGGSAGYGRHKIWRSLKADNSATLRNALDRLPDSSYFDADFTAIATAGEQPPRDIPDMEELTRFAVAWMNVQDLMNAGKPEDQAIAAIEAEDLSLKRYNRLAELTASYPSIKNTVTELVLERKAAEQ